MNTLRKTLFNEENSSKSGQTTYLFEKNAVLNLFVLNASKSSYVHLICVT